MCPVHVPPATNFSDSLTHDELSSSIYEEPFHEALPVIPAVEAQLAAVQAAFAQVASEQVDNTQVTEPSNIPNPVSCSASFNTLNNMLTMGSASFQSTTKTSRTTAMIIAMRATGMLLLPAHPLPQSTSKRVRINRPRNYFGLKSKPLRVTLPMGSLPSLQYFPLPYG